MRFRKLPVEIEAVQFTGENWNELTTFFGTKSGDRSGVWQSHVDTLRIKTLEGIMVASKGDWIIRGIAGECYPCKPDIFAKTYEAIVESFDDTRSY